MFFWLQKTLFVCDAVRIIYIFPAFVILFLEYQNLLEFVVFSSQILCCNNLSAFTRITRHYFHLFMLMLIL